MINDEKLIKIDETDQKILRLLSKDGRMSYRKISRELGISVGTVHNRVEKFTNSGIIKKFVPLIDHSKLGYKLTTVIGVRVKGGVLSNWENKTAYNKNVLGIYDVTGEFDAILIAKFRDTTELDAFVKDLLKEGDVQRTYTQTVLNTVKEDLGSSDILNSEKR